MPPLPEAMTTWRLLTDSFTDPFMHFAVEEAVIRMVDEGKSPNTLRIRKVKPSVWIGIFQDAREEVDVPYCRKNDIKIVRRLNPGGAVYQDEGTFCYSAFFRKSFFNNFKDISPEGLYGIFGKIIINACSGFNIHAILSPVNDITVNGRKIYGSAQFDFYDSFIHSGSFLFNVNKEEMNRTLRPSTLKFADKTVKDIKERVVNFSDLLGEEVKMDEFIDAFINKFITGLKIQLVNGDISPDEMKLAEQLYRTKYSGETWTFNPQNNHSIILSTKIDSGVLILSFNISDGRISELAVKGDFMITDQRALIQFIHDVKDNKADEILAKLNHAALPADLKEGISKLLAEFQNSITNE